MRPETRFGRYADTWGAWAAQRAQRVTKVYHCSPRPKAAAVLIKVITKMFPCFSLIDRYTSARRTGPGRAGPPAGPNVIIPWPASQGAGALWCP